MEEIQKNNEGIQATHQILEELVGRMGFRDFSVSYNEESRRFSIFINDGPFLEKFIPNFVTDFDFIIKFIARKAGAGVIFLDINNYRKDREDLIRKLAKAAAKKAVVNNQIISLPPMNAFERRIIHSELSMHPDIKTESEGEGKSRHILVKPIE